MPGAVHDTKAGWICGVLAGLEAAGLVTAACADVAASYRRRRIVWL